MATLSEREREPVFTSDFQNSNEASKIYTLHNQFFLFKIIYTEKVFDDCTFLGVMFSNQSRLFVERHLRCI